MTSQWVSTPPVIPRAASTMVMVIPSLKVLRDGTAVPDRSDGRSGLLMRPRPITPTRRRDMPASMCGWKVSVDDTEGVTGLQVRPNPPALPKLLGTSCEAVDP